MTPAASYLADRQRQHSPGPRDRARELYQVLDPYLPQQLRALVDEGAVAIGAIGTTFPFILTTPIPPNGHVIEFSTGLMMFVYAVSRALAGGTNVITRSEAVQSGTLTVEGVAPRIAKTFRTWKRHHQWPWRYLPFGRPRIDKYDFPLTKASHPLAEDLAIRAEAFMLAHELGHVLIDGKLAPADERDEETRADDIGFRLFLPTEHSRTGVAAAVWAIRILAGLQRSGFRFADEYPSPERRMDALFHVLRTLGPSDRYADESSTIAVAHASYIDAAERILYGEGAVPPRDERQTRITMLAILEEIVLGGISPAQGATDLAATARAVGPQVRRAAFDTLVRYYCVEVLTVEGYIPQHTALQMGKMLREIAGELPADMGDDLRAALDRVPPTD